MKKHLEIGAKAVLFFGLAAFLLAAAAKILPASAPLSPDDGDNPPDFAKDGMRGMWISYLEFENVDFSSRQTFRRDMEKIFSDCANMGLNTVIVHTRPFGDALYKSEIFPFSHLMTGRQGGNPGYDPLEIMTGLAHQKGLRIEAWINPYRVRLGSKPRQLSRDNPANDSSLTVERDGNLYYNPALPRTTDLICRGVREIVKNYRVDGIHFDDYFYPSADPAVDSRQYARYTGDLPLDRWRREQVNNLVKKVYDTIKGINSRVTFGISPRGNNDNNYNIQYSDVKLWMSQPGYVDYIMPQLYWGFDYRGRDGSYRFAFDNVSREWAGYPRCDSVSLYAGLAAYRIGGEDREWQSGSNISKMIKACEVPGGMEGYCLYRYDNLFNAGENRRLRRQETARIREVNRE